MKKFLTMCALCVCGFATSFSQGVSTNTLTQYVSTNNAGNEFWISFPPIYDEESSGEKMARVFVASPIAQTITVEVPGKGFSETKMAIANSVIEFKIPILIAQPYAKPAALKAPAEQVYESAGVHVVSESAPVVVYGVSRLSYTSDGFLALPISGLGTEYVIGSWPQFAAIGSGYNLPSESNIVAAFDQTTVTFVMGGTNGSKTTGGMTAGQSRTWVLNRGDVLCFANADDGQDISGSLVTSDKPVAVVSGNQCANVPMLTYACDHLCEMELGTHLWGREYHVTPVVDRRYNPIIRVFAHPGYRDVKVYRDGVEWFVIPNNARTENEAFVEKRVFDGPPHSTVVTADAPIYVMLYNTGQSEDNVPSDPFQYVLTPFELYQKEIVFATPNAKGSTISFDRNYVNLVYALDQNDAIPQDLEFGTVTGTQIQWQSVVSAFGSDVGQKFVVPASTGDNYAMKRLTLPKEGVYRIRASKPFAAYSYGFSNYDSYGFPTSASILDLSIDDTIPPIISESVRKDTLFTGTIVDPMSGDKRSAIASISQVKEYSTNTEFSYNAGKGLYPKNTQAITWQIKVIDKTKNARCVFVVADRAGNYSYKDYTYTAADAGSLVLQAPSQMELNISKENFLTEKLILQNTYKSTSFVVKDITSSDNENFIINKEDIVGRTIKPSENLQLSIKFQPKTYGSYSSKITLATESDNSIDVMVGAKAVRNRLELSGPILFDSTLIDQTSTQNKSLVIYPGQDEFSADTKITDITALPENSVSFDVSSYGTRGFQIDKSGVVNKVLKFGKDPLVVPIKFKPVKEGLHTASINIDGEGGVNTGVTIAGYGKTTLSSAENEPEQIAYTLYPNPAKKVCTIQGLNGKSRISIINLLGEEKLSIEGEEKEVNLVLSSLSAGKYYVQINDNNGKIQLPLTIVSE